MLTFKTLNYGKHVVLSLKMTWYISFTRLNTKNRILIMKLEKTKCCGLDKFIFIVYI